MLSLSRGYFFLPGGPLVCQNLHYAFQLKKARTYPLNGFLQMGQFLKDEAQSAHEHKWAHGRITIDTFFSMQILQSKSI